MERGVLSFDGIDNFRDFGGYLSRWGGRVSPLRLFRSAHHDHATSKDFDVLQSLGIDFIVDLRRPSERKDDDSHRAARCAGVIIQNDIGDRSEGPHVAFMRETDMSASSIETYLSSYYASAPFEPRHKDLFRRYFQALRMLDGAALIHCTAGKDRTGILAAITQNLLGVHDDDVKADFLLTNAVMDVERRISEMRPAVEKLIGRAPSTAAIRAFLGVEARHLEACFDAIKTQSVSIEHYVVDYLGIDQADVQATREKFLR